MSNAASLIVFALLVLIAVWGIGAIVRLMVRRAKPIRSDRVDLSGSRHRSPSRDTFGGASIHDGGFSPAWHHSGGSCSSDAGGSGGGGGDGGGCGGD
jgi:hypothetical protein